MGWFTKAAPPPKAGFFAHPLASAMLASGVGTIVGGLITRRLIMSSEARMAKRLDSSVDGLRKEALGHARDITGVCGTMASAIAKQNEVLSRMASAMQGESTPAPEGKAE